MGNRDNAASGAAFKVHGDAGTRTRRRSPHRAQTITTTHVVNRPRGGVTA